MELYEEIVKRFIAEFNYKLLASGVFSTVLSREGSNFVIKVGRSRCSETLDGWLEFALWAQRIESNHFPKGIKILRPPKSVGDVFVARMERLQCTIAQARHNKEAKPNSLSIEDVSTLSEACREFRHNPTQWSNHIHQRLSGRWPLLGQDLTALSDNFSSNWNFDLHSKNVMLRADGSLVIVDPILKLFEPHD